MLQNAYLLENIGADTAEIEQNFAEILPICPHRGQAPSETAAACPSRRRPRSAPAAASARNEDEAGARPRGSRERGRGAWG